MDSLKKELSQFLEEAGLEKKKEKIDQIEKKMQDPDFWKDHRRSSKLAKKLSILQKGVEKIQRLKVLAQKGQKEDFKKLIEKLKINLYLSGKHDDEDAVFAIHAGQGGTEAMDWSQMLLRMYTRFFEKKNWKWKMIDKTSGEEAGIKSATLTVSDSLVYGLLKSERGVHRLVRQSPFNADNLRQTSFALVEVWPLLEEAPEVSIKNKDLEWDFFKATGPGGQYVNKASTAVRVKHKPSGIAVSCRQERSQAQNRETALKILRAKLLVKKEEAQQERISQLRGKFKIPGWGNQIRSYVLHPYHLVKDLRTNFETHDTESVLDGEIEPFIKAYLKKLVKAGNLKEEDSQKKGVILEDGRE